VNKMNDYKVGDVVDGIVTSIKKYGAFLSFENCFIGLLHISEISSHFINNIFNYVHVGDKIKVVVKKVDSVNKYLSVSVKDLPKVDQTFVNNETSKDTVYLQEVDFTKLEKSLPNMVEKELQKEKKV